MNIRLEKHLGYMWSKGVTGRSLWSPRSPAGVPRWSTACPPPAPWGGKAGICSWRASPMLSAAVCLFGVCFPAVGMWLRLGCIPPWPSPVPSAEEVLRKVTHSFSIYILNDNSMPETRVHGGNMQWAKQSTSWTLHTGGGNQKKKR